MPTSAPLARRMSALFEPICLVNFFCEEPNEAMAAIGLTNYWDGYFAGRSAPLGPVPADVVHALFYSFAEGEAARHLPSVWDRITPEQAIAARERGCVAALRRILGDLAGSAGLARAADLLTEAAVSPPARAGHLRRPARAAGPRRASARLWHAADMPREHRGDGHVAACMAEGVGGTESHVLSALDMGIHPAETFGRIHHLPEARLAAVMDGLRARDLIDASGHFTDAGRATRSGSRPSPTGSRPCPTTASPPTSATN